MQFSLFLFVETHSEKSTQGLFLYVNHPPFRRSPNCGTADSMKNGTTRRGKQNHKGRVRLWRGEALCSRQFVENPQWKRRKPESTTMIDRLLLEKMPLAGSAHVLKLSASWLQPFNLLTTQSESIGALCRRSSELTALYF